MYINALMCFTSHFTSCAHWLPSLPAGHTHAKHRPHSYAVTTQAPKTHPTPSGKFRFRARAPDRIVMGHYPYILFLSFSLPTHSVPPFPIFVETLVMLQLILHGIGDYFLQTDWQALNKKRPGWLGFWACLKHCLTYSLPFLLIASPVAVLFIFLSHFVIDRTNLVAYLIAIKNGCRKAPSDRPSYSFLGGYDVSNFGFSSDRPFAISIWLYIICDNLLHIICNYVAILVFG